MATVTLDLFVHEIALALGDMPDGIAENFVRQAAIDFCERSQIIRRVVDIDLICGVSDYPILLPDERIVSIQRVCVGDRCCAERAVLSASAPCETGCTFHGHSIWFVPPDSLNIRPTPSVDRAKAIRVHVAVAPLRDACELDSVLYERYHETILDGALARLYLAKTTPWHDKELANLHKTQFDQGIAAAGLDRLTGDTRGPFKMAFRRII